jgi:hypothetical protein
MPTVSLNADGIVGCTAPSDLPGTGTGAGWRPDDNQAAAVAKHPNYFFAACPSAHARLVIVTASDAIARLNPTTEA